MTNRQLVKSLSRSSKSTSSSNIQLHICGVPFSLDRELVAGRSAKIFVLLEENPNGDISHLLRDIPADPEAFELVVRFCHGFELNISAENIVPLSCLAHYLGMTETHSPDNLLKKALTYFERTIIPSWNESVKALQASEKVLKQAASLGLVDACAESIIAKAQVNPRHLGDPIMNSMYKDDDGEDKENGYRPNERRRLFVLDRLPEGLTILSLEILSLQLYEPIVREMIQRQVPPEYVAASVCQYAKKWVFSSTATGDDMSIYKRNSQREAIEAVERLLPLERGLLPCTLLFEMLNSAIFLEASSECRAGFEIRVGKQLDQAKVNDLLIPSQGYAKEVEYDVECVQRILKNFYCNYTHSDVSGLIKVAELVENLLAEVASDVDLKTSTFITLAEMTTSASVGMHRNSDGIYRAIDLYLDKHRFLTESEREEVCKVLDCHNLSPKAREQAAQNRQLPLRVVVQVLFVGQLSLRERVTKEVEASDERLRKVVAEEEEEEEEEAARVSGGEDEVRVEMEKMGSKVMELERECLMMRREIQSGCCGRAKREKTSVWREVKRKFGCVSSMHDCNCHVIKKKKVHPRQ